MKKILRIGAGFSKHWKLRLRGGFVCLFRRGFIRYRARMIFSEKFRVFGRFAAAVLWLAVAGCSGIPLGEGGLPPAAAEEGPAEEYRLQSGDEIDLQIYREPQLSGTFRVDSGGAIRHPLAGAFQVGGLTVDEAEDGLAALLGEKYLVNPRVMLSIVSAQSSHVVVLGEVKNPGLQPIPFGGSMTLLQAVAEAGGFTDLASVNRVTVTRTENGEEHSIRVKVTRMISGEEPDLQLKPNDLIVVPQIIF